MAWLIGHHENWWDLGFYTRDSLDKNAFIVWWFRTDDIDPAPKSVWEWWEDDADHRGPNPVHLPVPDHLVWALLRLWDWWRARP